MFLSLALPLISSSPHSVPTASCHCPHSADETGACTIASGFCPAYGSISEAAVNVGAGVSGGSRSGSIAGGTSTPASSGAVYQGQGEGRV